MTAHTAQSRPAAGSRPVKLLAAEVLKLATLPAARWTLAATGLLTVLTAVLFAPLYLDSDAAAAGTGDVLDVALRPIEYVQAGFLLLGILAIASEYPGTIRTTLTTTPRRIRVLLIKALALTIYTLPAAAIAVAAGFAVTRLIVGDDIDAPGIGPTLGRLAPATAYLALAALIAYAVATVLRRTVPSVAVVLGYFFIAGPLLRNFGAALWAPDAAGYSLWYPSNASPDLTVPAGWVILAAWTLGLLAVGGAAFKIRDA